MILQTDAGRFKLLFMHDVKTLRETYCEVQPLGDVLIQHGKAVSEMTLPMFNGRSHCAAGDQFCRRVGRKVALTRALKSYPKLVRQAIWHAYWRSGQRP